MLYIIVLSAMKVKRDDIVRVMFARERRGLM